MLYYIKPHNEYICSISVDSEFDFGNSWSLVGETDTHFYMNTNNIDKAYAVAKALGVNVITVSTAWEIDPCLLEYDGYYLDTLTWSVEYWDNLPMEMIDAIIATGDTYGFDLYTKAYAYMRNGISVANNPIIDWDAPAPELPDEALSPEEEMMITLSLQLGVAEAVAECEAVDNTEPTIGLCKVSSNEFGYVAELWNGDIWDSLSDSDFCEFDELINIICCNAHVITKLDTSRLNDDDATVLIEHYFDSLPVLIHDVKLDDVELPVIVPQEVVSEPQEELFTTILNEDAVMNTSTVWLDWSISPCLKAWELDFGTYVPVVESEPVVEPVELTGQYSQFACHISDGWTGQYSDVLEGWVGKASEFACHISDGWTGKCCSLADAPKPVEPKSDQSEVEARVARACAKMARASSYGSPVRYGTINPTIHLTNPTTTPTTTNSEVAVSSVVERVSDEQFKELDIYWEFALAHRSPSNIYVNKKICDFTSSDDARDVNLKGTDPSKCQGSNGYGESPTNNNVTEFKSTLFNVDEYDITRNVVVDVATTTPKATPKATVAPKAPATPKLSTATFAPNFNSSVIAKYTALNGGIIKDSLILNKLTSALRSNNIEAYNKYVTTFNNPQAVALHRQAYDAVVSAS